MVSDFRQKKYLHIFNAFFDVDRSGSIEKKDFEAALAKAAKIRGWSTSDPKYKEAEETLLKIWDALLKADTDSDGQVSVNEWVAMCDNYATKPRGGEDWPALYAKFIFLLQDASNDGSIDQAEFVQVMASFGLDKEECAKSFAKISNGKTEVTWTDFQGLWKEYFLSEDVNAAGNFIFGKSSF